MSIISVDALRQINVMSADWDLVRLLVCASDTRPPDADALLRKVTLVSGQPFVHV